MTHEGDDDELSGLVPEAWWDRLQQSLTDPQWQPRVDRAASAPLPPRAVRFYTGAGCWLLATELERLTQLPLGAEVNPWGRALHVFTIDGDDAIDAFGRTPIRTWQEIEAAGGRIELDVALDAMLATLDQKVWTAQGAAEIRAMLASPDYLACAATAARAVAAATGLV